MNHLIRLVYARRFVAPPSASHLDPIEDAVRFMRDADDAVDTAPGERRALTSVPVPSSQPSRRAARGNAPSRPSPRRTPPAGVSGNTNFMLVVAGVARVCLAAVVFLMFRSARTRS